MTFENIVIKNSLPTDIMKHVIYIIKAFLNN